MTDPALAHALATGEQAFARVGCARCHIPSLPLGRAGWKSIGAELQPRRERAARTGHALRDVNLTDPRLPESRLLPSSSTALTVDVPAFTDFKLHDITNPRQGRRRTTGHQPAHNVAEIFGGQPSFPDAAPLGRRQRAAILSSWPLHDVARGGDGTHAGEAVEERRSFERLSRDEHGPLISS